MRRSLLLLPLLIARAALAEPSGDPFEGKLRPISPEWTMSAQEVMRYALPYLHRVTSCYQRSTAGERYATGELYLYLVISREGRVVHHEATAPGVGGFRFLTLERCLANEIRTWHFPTRKGFTNTWIPYYFLQTRAPASGPFPGCWNPRGCPDQPSRLPPKTI